MFNKLSCIVEVLYESVSDRVGNSRVGMHFLEVKTSFSQSVLHMVNHLLLNCLFVSGNISFHQGPEGF